jgi:hypothetical protein
MAETDFDFVVGEREALKSIPTNSKPTSACGPSRHIAPPRDLGR